MNGYTALMPRFMPLINELPSVTARQALAEAGVTTLVIHTNLPGGLAMARILQGVKQEPMLRRLTLGDTIVVNLGNPPEPPAPLAGAPLPSAGWRLAGSDPGVERAVDGDLATHWTAKTFDRPSFLRVDLGAEHRVTGVRIALGPHIPEFPHEWEAWGWRVGGTWEQLGGERVTHPPFASYLRDHRAIVLDLRLRESTVRFLELRVPPESPLALFASHGDGTWGIHELAIYARDAPPAAP
jgi:hypothetical protein